MMLDNAQYSLLIGNLKDLRVRAGLTQKELARKSGVSTFTITHIETGAAGKTRRGVAEKLWAALTTATRAAYRHSYPFDEGQPGITTISKAQLAAAPAGGRKIHCPHCLSPSYTMLETPIPGVEYKCIACSRVFRVDVQGRSYIPDRPPAIKTGTASHHEETGDGR